MYSSEAKTLVEKKAYQLWQEDGCAHGRDMMHWLRAEQELAAMPHEEVKTISAEQQTNGAAEQHEGEAQQQSD